MKDEPQSRPQKPEPLENQGPVSPREFWAKLYLEFQKLSPKEQKEFRQATLKQSQEILAKSAKLAEPEDLDKLVAEFLPPSQAQQRYKSGWGLMLPQDLSKAVMDILQLNAWLNDHYNSCPACQELQRKDRRLEDDEVCREYADRHRDMREMLANLPLRELKALAEVTKEDWFEKDVTGLTRSVKALLRREREEEECKQPEGNRRRPQPLANTLDPVADVAKRKASQDAAHALGRQNAPAETNGGQFRISGDMGPQVLDFIFEQMQIDPEWSSRDDRSLTWWGHRLAQRIWAEPVRSDAGFDIVRVHAETDVLRKVPDNPRTAKSLSLFNQDASLSGYVWNQQTQRVSLRCAAYFHAQNFDWLRRVFVSAVAIQAAEAHDQAEALAKVVGGEPDESTHPANGSRLEKDDMLNVIRDLIAPRGREPSTWTDFQSALKLNPEPWVMANAGDNGLTAEFPFPGCMPPTALLTADNKGIHPRLGSGLLLVLRLPLDCHGVEVESLAAKLNMAELAEFTRCHFMGAWCVDTDNNTELLQQGQMLFGGSVPVPADLLKQEANETLTHCSFFPSATYGAGPVLLQNLLQSMAHRARWANEYLASKAEIADRFGPRDSRAFKQQSEARTSHVIGFLNKLKREFRKKPN